MEKSFDKLKKNLDKLGIQMTGQMEEQFSIYYNLLIEWNKNINLTAVTAFDDVVEKHFLDSIILGHFIDLDRRLTIVDVGTGAGFPGIPLKIIYPKLEIVLADSSNKRIRFLDEVILSLKLEGITVVHGRAEELARNVCYREKFDLAVSRAVANLSVLSEYCLPFVKIGGIFIAYKSGDIEDEMAHAQKAVKLLGGKTNQMIKFELPSTEYQRSFVFVNKEKGTSKKYPRKAGTPTKQPLS